MNKLIWAYVFCLTCITVIYAKEASPAGEKKEEAHPEVSIDLGDFYRLEGNVDRAIEYYKQAAKQKKDKKIRAVAQKNLGQLYQQKGDNDQAINYYKQAAKQNNNKEAKTISQLSLGTLYEKQGNEKQAIEYYEMAADQTDNKDAKSEAQLHLGEIYAKKEGKEEQAIQNYEESEKSADEQVKVDALLHLGILYYQRGEIEKAKEYFMNAKKITINSFYRDLASYILTLLYDEQGNKRVAQRIMKVMAQQDNDLLLKRFAQKVLDKVS